MTSPRQRQADLQERFPDFEAWYVPQALGGVKWYGRLRGETNLLNTLQADSSAELAELIEQAQAANADHRACVLGPEPPEK